MTNTTLLASLAQLIKQRLTLTAKERKLAKQERGIVQEMGRVLPRIGYRLESVNGRPDKREGVCGQIGLSCQRASSAPDVTGASPYKRMWPGI